MSKPDWGKRWKKGLDEVCEDPKKKKVRKCVKPKRRSATSAKTK